MKLEFKPEEIFSASKNVVAEFPEIEPAIVRNIYVKGAHFMINWIHENLDGRSIQIEPDESTPIFSFKDVMDIVRTIKDGARGRDNKMYLSSEFHKLKDIKAGKQS